MAIVPNQIIKSFQETFRSQSVPAIYRAPGRVNLIGEHTDYNLGYVFPIALSMACYVAVAPASDGNFSISSRELLDGFSMPADQIHAAPPFQKWSDYVVGVAHELLKLGFPIKPCQLYVASDVPAGSGLSSSAALEIAAALALLGDRKLPPLDIALLAQRAESQFVGMPCGIMDQYTSVFGHAGAALQIDCRSQTHEYVKLPPEAHFIATNSMVKHELGTSAYRERVGECQAAVSAIAEIDPNVKSLRDVSLAVFERIQDSVPLVPRKRARHIISDTQRVVDFAAAARSHNLLEMGRLFVASHRSMQYDYEITCEEIDFLVDTAIKLPGVYGSRMTGGGFGGCTVTLLKPDAVTEFQDKLTAAYRERYNLTPVFYDCKPAAGAGRMS